MDVTGVLCVGLIEFAKSDALVEVVRVKNNKEHHYTYERTGRCYSRNKTAST